MKNSCYKKGIVLGIIVLFIGITLLPNINGFTQKNFSEVNETMDAPTIDGPSGGRVGVAYDYDFNAVDPDGDDVRYYIDWGDGTTTDWIYWWYPSGEPVTVSHTYHIVGYVTISARAKDIYGAIGNESTFTFYVGKSKSIVNSLLLWFLDGFPLLERLLNLI